MTGFLIVSGKPSFVRDISLIRVQDFCKATSMSCYPITISPSKARNRLVIGLQLTHKGADDTVKAYSGKYVFLHGTLFGLLGSENVDTLRNDQARRFLASEVDSRGEFWPGTLDGACSVGLVSSATGNIEVFNDSQGWRRIFYYKDQNVFIVSTRLPLILRLLRRDWQLDRQGARVFLAHREPRWPLSAVKDIRTLPPVHRLVVEDGEVQIASYWQPAKPNAVRDRKEVAMDLRRALTLAVRRKAKGRKTVVTLSGGYDSTCLSKLCTSLDCDITGMSVGYAVDNRSTDCNTYDETEYASRIARRMAIRFQRQLFEPADVREAMTVLPGIIDQPGHDPTSFFLFCRAAREHGYQAVITGIGGDACFTQKDRLAKEMILLPCFQMASRIPFGDFALGILTKAVPRLAALWQAYSEGRSRAHSLFELMERFNVSATLQINKALLGETVVEDLNELTTLRAKVLDRAIENASCPHEWHYLFALWTSPGNYHVDSSITYSGMASIMPFVEPVTTRVLFSHAAQHSLDTRRFEMEIVEGIPKGLLIPSKSGFCLPYERWCRELLLDDLEDMLGDDDWLRLGLNMTQISEYVTMFKHPNCHGRVLVDRDTASFLWRLVMLKRYREANNLRI